MANDYQYDFIVIGAGSGGVRAARFAASFGAKVAIIEKRFYGGTCVNVGCVPKKMFAYAAEGAQVTDIFATFGQRFEHLGFDWSTLKANKDNQIQRLNGIYEKLLTNAGVTIYQGHGRIEAPHKVSINGEQTLTGAHILLATGGKPFVPNVPGKEHALISDDLFYFEQLPKRVAVVGGGYIATEYAAILNGLGVETHQIYRGSRLLRGFDGDIQDFVTQRVQGSGTHLHLNTDITAIEVTKTGKRLHTNQAPLEVDEVIYATGRVPHLDNVLAPGLELTLTASGKVAVDEGFATNIAGVYAVGDIIEGMELTPVA